MKIPSRCPRPLFQNLAKPALAAVALLGTLELAAQANVMTRTWGLKPFLGEGYIPNPDFCDAATAPTLNAHFTNDELTLIGGLYRGALNDKLSGRADAIEAAVAASVLTGVSVEFILVQMLRESSLGVNRAATTSTARGNLQATQSTWMDLVYNRIKMPNDKHYMSVYGPYLNKVEGWLDKGQFKYRTQNARVESYLLDARLKDPTFEAYVFAKQWAREYPAIVRADHTPFPASLRMTGEIVGNWMKGLVGSLPTSWRMHVDSDFRTQADAYRTHFVGATGDDRLQSLLPKNIDASAEFADQAVANPNIFIKGDGKHRTPIEVYDFLNEGTAKALRDLADISYGGASLGQACEQARIPVPLPRPDPR